MDSVSRSCAGPPSSKLSCWLRWLLCVGLCVTHTGQFKRPAQATPPAPLSSQLWPGLLAPWACVFFPVLNGLDLSLPCGFLFFLSGCAACGLASCLEGSPIVGHGLGCCGTWEFSSPAGERTHIPFRGRQPLSHWPARAAPPLSVLYITLTK